MDWLHIADKGVAPFFLSGLFNKCLSLKEWGPNQGTRLRRLWGLIKAFYKEHGVKDTLNELSKPMLDNHLQSLGAAEARALVPFALKLTSLWLQELELTAEIRAANDAASHLVACYDCLHEQASALIRQGHMLDAAVAFHHLLVQLHLLDAETWLLKPKHHLFLEMCLEGIQPHLTWTYRDESHGGSVSHQAHRKGGQATPLAISQGALTLFASRESFPRLWPEGGNQ